MLRVMHNSPDQVLDIEQLRHCVDGDKPFRLIGHAGREGWQASSVHTRLKLPINPSELGRGTLTLWMLPLEELSYRYACADKRKTHPGTDFNNHILIGDHPDLENVHDSHFALIWDAGWYPQFWAKFFHGYLYHSGFYPDPKLLAVAGLASFQRLRWYQVGMSWDKTEGYAAIYINGIKVGERPDENQMLTADDCGDALYAGSTAFAVGDIARYDSVLTPGELESIYKAEASDFDAEAHQALRDMYYGENSQAFAFTPTAEWSPSLELPLNRPEDLERFYVQGRIESPSITPDGLLIETGPDMAPPGSKHDNAQMYLWTEDTFEGDLYVTYEFMPLKPGGLSLLLTQASGLHGEDFMADYERRTTGSMSMVCWENVRNYHWEYYREVSDVPPNAATSGFIKNPWCTPLAYRCEWKPLAKKEWHRLEFLQEGNRIRGAIDGVLMHDVTDNGFRGNGPVYHHGHIAIRCMLRSKILFRNLQVLNRKPDYEVIEG